MDNLSTYADAQIAVVSESATVFLSQLAVNVPTIIGALVLFIVGLFIARAFRGIARNFTRWTGLNRAADATGVDDVLAKAGLSGSVIDVVAVLVYWIVILIFASAALEMLGLKVVVDTVNSLIAYLPNVIAAVIVMLVTVGIAKFVGGIIREWTGQFASLYSNAVTMLAEVMMIVFGATISLSQLGLNITFITANLTALIVGLIVTVTLSVGLGSRNLSANILAGYYVKNQYKKGDKVVLGGHDGTIKEITSTAVVMESNGKTVVVPNDEVIRNGSK